MKINWRGKGVDEVGLDANEQVVVKVAPATFADRGRNFVGRSDQGKENCCHLKSVFLNSSRVPL